ncbi:hypothetical protein ACLB2K_072402 [Fragaria x ananassa]
MACDLRHCETDAYVHIRLRVSRDCIAPVSGEANASKCSPVVVPLQSVKVVYSASEKVIAEIQSREASLREELRVAQEKIKREQAALVTCREATGATVAQLHKDIDILKNKVTKSDGVVTSLHQELKIWDE